MKKGLTRIVFVVDRSGSMSSIAEDMIGGFNKFIADQRALKVGTCEVSYFQFDNVFETVYRNVDIEFVKDLDHATFVPRGGTALYDGVGQAIDLVGKELSELDESQRPERVLFVTITDGGENSSKTFTVDRVKSMIEIQTNKYSWEFTYLGANQNAWDVGQTMGVKASSTMTYAANSVGTKGLFDSLSKQTSAYRSCKGFAYDAEDLKAQKDAGV